MYEICLHKSMSAISAMMQHEALIGCCGAATKNTLERCEDCKLWKEEAYDLSHQLGFPYGNLWGDRMQMVCNSWYNSFPSWYNSFLTSSSFIGDNGSILLELTAMNAKLASFACWQFRVCNAAPHILPSKRLSCLETNLKEGVHLPYATQEQP